MPFLRAYLTISCWTPSAICGMVSSMNLADIEPQGQKKIGRFSSGNSLPNLTMVVSSLAMPRLRMTVLKSRIVALIIRILLALLNRTSFANRVAVSGLMVRLPDSLDILSVLVQHSQLPGSSLLMKRFKRQVYLSYESSFLAYLTASSRLPDILASSRRSSNFCI